MRSRALLVAFDIALAGCGGTGEEAEAPEQQTPATTETEEAAPERDPHCMAVPPAVVKAISTGLEVQGGGSLRFAQAVKSDDFESVYFVSADIQGAGLEGDDDVATWATNRLRVGGLTFAVDSVAQEFSDWGDADKTDANLTMDDDGAELSRDCVESVAK